MRVSRSSGNNLGARVGRLVACWAAVAAVVATARGQEAPPTAPPPATAAARPPAAATPAAPIWPDEVVILQGAADVEEFWKKLGAPDWVISRPAPGRLRGAAPGNADESIVDAVRVEGTVGGDHARIAIGVDCSLMTAGPAWVPLKIDAPVVLAAREGDRELELRRGAGGRWEARLEGARTHALRIEATAPVRINAERRTLELAIPEAPATSFDLVLPRRSYDVDAGPGEALRPTPVEGGEGLRVAAHVAPRSPLVVSWSEPGEAGERAAPLLAAQVEMAVVVDAEGVVVRSSWAIACARGVARSLQIRLEDDEVVSRIQLNDQFPASGIERSGGGNLLTIPLAEPMRSGESRKLVLETRRPASGTRLLNFSGYPLTDAGEQSGFLGVTHGPNLFVNVAKSQGLRRIDPRDLPTALKARPGTTLALQFLEQPFALAIGVEDAPPLFSTEAVAELSLDPEVVRNETTLEVRRVRGTLFEVEVAVPADMKVVSVGPPDLVEAATPPQPDAAAAAADPADAERILKIRLTSQARDRPAFSLKLSGRQPAPGPGDVRLGLFAARGAVSTNAAFVVRAGRDVSLEPRDATLVKETAAEPPPPPPGAEADLRPPGLRLRTGRNPATLDLRLERRPLAVRRETRLTARVSRRTVEVRQETTLRVRHGALPYLDVVVPVGVSARWEASDEKQPIRTEDLEDARSGARRSRLHFQRPVVDAAVLTFQYRIPLGRSLDPASPTPLRIPWIEPEEGTPGGCVVELSTEPDVQVAVDDPAWAEIDEPSPPGPRTGRAYRLDRDDQSEGLAVAARLVETVVLPPTVASRALIRSTLEPEGDLRVRAWYAVDSHPAWLSVALPEGARWLRARVDGRTLDRIDVGPDGTTSRIDLPADSIARPLLLDLEYRLPAAGVRRTWLPPALLDDAEVLQAYWLVQVPWSQAVAGQPRGWADENEWYWDVYAWKRRPVASSAGLIAWAAGPTAPPAAVDDALDVEAISHGYLFSRVGPPSPINPWVVSRAWTVLVCSGLALLGAVGLFFVPITTPWLVGAVVAVGLPTAMFLPPGVLALVVQSAAFGIAFGALVHVGRRWTLRRGATAPPARGTSMSNVVVGESSQRSAPGVGSDDSTAIRVRTSSTMDYISTPSPQPESDASLSPRRLRTE
ncbi:hypothetical protein [Planctomyces sp. SH-PL62]|uniref:hypothetical protein n=1 Tax=Planctomyces sp. SH-PL62 TaxID=1636152 RepID=UPI00078EE146|nr:hypothetical protein [Planctomyces sp. SH-PL62]AMV37127.1 hypothetical protein VT85_06825 [Planctomyces sp. SH-PL62]